MEGITHISFGGLSVGCKFKPTDEELVRYYLWNKVIEEPLPSEHLVKDCDLYGTMEPWDIWERYGGGDTKEDDLYFFTRLKKKSEKSERIQRTVGTNGGTWHGEQTGKTMKIEGDDREIAFTCKRFRYENSSIQAHDGHWIMLEYRLDPSTIRTDIVLCRLRKNRRKRKVSELMTKAEHEVEVEEKHHQTATIGQCGGTKGFMDFAYEFAVKDNRPPQSGENMEDQSNANLFNYGGPTAGKNQLQTETISVDLSTMQPSFQERMENNYATELIYYGGPAMAVVQNQPRNGTIPAGLSTVEPKIQEIVGDDFTADWFNYDGPNVEDQNQQQTGTISAGLSTIQPEFQETMEDNCTNDSNNRGELTEDELMKLTGCSTSVDDESLNEPLLEEGPTAEDQIQQQTESISVGLTTMQLEFQGTMVDMCNNDLINCGELTEDELMELVRCGELTEDELMELTHCGELTEDELMELTGQSLSLDDDYLNEPLPEEGQQDAAFVQDSSNAFLPSFSPMTLST